MIKLQQNGTLWRDTDGNELHAHGGHILFHGGFYYWYGEDRRDDIYVSVYRSRDLVNWEFRAHCLTVSSKFEPIAVHTDSSLSHERDGKAVKVNIERPKVLYNALTDTFVMWAHYENGLDYSNARICIATSKTPTENSPIAAALIPTERCHATARFSPTLSQEIRSSSQLHGITPTLRFTD